MNQIWKYLEDKGLVKFEVLSDDVSSYDDLVGDMFNPESNPDISPEQLKTEEKELNNRINQDGIYKIHGSVKCSCCGTFKIIDSVCGFIGDDWKDSDYDSSVKYETIKEYFRMNCPTNSMFPWTRKEETI